MNETFRRHVESLHPAFERLVVSSPLKYGQVKDVQLPLKGVCLLSDGDTHLYVGSSDNIRKRLNNHCRASASHFHAAFAFRLAREVCGVPKASYKRQGSRADLMTQEDFKATFAAQKARLREMDRLALAGLEALPVV